MKSLIRIIAVAGCLVVWGAAGQDQSEGGGPGLYVTPAYSGDFGGTYTTPAFSGGSVEPAQAPGTGDVLGSGGGGERDVRGRPSYGAQDFGAYTTPAFSAPVLGLRVSPAPIPKAQPTQPKSSAGTSKADPSTGNTPAKPSGTSEKPTDSRGTSTNRLENPAPPPTSSTNGPAGQGTSGPL